MKRFISLLLALTTLISCFAFAMNTFAANNNPFQNAPITGIGYHIQYKSNGRATLSYKWKAKKKGEKIYLVHFSLKCDTLKIGTYTKSVKNKESGTMVFDVPQGEKYYFAVSYKRTSKSQLVTAKYTNKISVKLKSAVPIKSVYLNKANAVVISFPFTLPSNSGIDFQICTNSSFFNCVRYSIYNPKGLACHGEGRYTVVLGPAKKLMIAKGKKYYVRYKVKRPKQQGVWSSAKAFVLK